MCLCMYMIICALVCKYIYSRVRVLSECVCKYVYNLSLRQKSFEPKPEKFVLQVCIIDFIKFMYFCLIVRVCDPIISTGSLHSKIGTKFHSLERIGKIWKICVGEVNPKEKHYSKNKKKTQTILIYDALGKKQLINVSSTKLFVKIVKKK